ncbi:MAG: hypothetical protein KIS76_06855 [Pyrinomonadaceae bacterium]|nr:hypothetical protein [Pyrinomonadaceae bacterium]
MLNKILSVAIIFLLLNLAVAPSVWASGNAEKEAKLAEKVKTGIAKLGTGKEAKVKIKLKNGNKMKGYISEIGEEQFIVQNEKTGESVVSYSSVKQIKGNNLSKQTAIIIGFVAFFAVLVIILVAQKENT